MGLRWETPMLAGMYAMEIPLRLPNSRVVLRPSINVLISGIGDPFCKV